MEVVIWQSCGLPSVSLSNSLVEWELKRKELKNKLKEKRPRPISHTANIFAYSIRLQPDLHKQTLSADTKSSNFQAKVKQESGQNL